MQAGIVYDLLIILGAGLVAGVVCRHLRVSVLVGYLLVGALIGDGALGWVSDEQHEIESLAEVGVFLLLFSIGLEFSLEELGRLGRNLVIGGGVQMLAVAAPVAAGLIAWGISWQAAVLIASATSFSSTVLVFKALSEWGHSALPHGRRAIGILLFQDAALVPLLLLVPLLTGADETVGPSQYLVLAAVSLVFVVAVVAIRDALGRWVIPTFARYRSPDLVVLFTLVLLGGVTLAAYTVGLPPAVGAFAAGLIFSGNRWTRQIDALVLPFRETFSAIFFVSLGLLFDFTLPLREPWAMLGSLVGLFVLKSAAATLALRLTGLPWQPAMGMGLGLAHVGEFAFVLVLLGYDSGILSQTAYRRIVSVAVGSLILTPLMLKTGLRWTGSSREIDSAVPETPDEQIAGAPAIVLGAGPIGRQVASQLEILGRDVCLVDLSPINLQPFAQEGFRTIAGDATDDKTLALADAAEATLAVVCVPADDTAIRIVKKLRGLNPDSLILVRCRYQVNASKLRSAGADQVVSEEVEASHALLKILTSPPGGAESS